MKPRILVWFSCGAASAVAGKETLKKYGSTHDVRLVNCDTRPSEDSDNYRFCREVEKWLACPITYIRSEKYGNIDEVFERIRYMSGINGARCTTELKKKPRQAYELPDDIHVFGFTANEGQRIQNFKKNNPELHLIWPLLDAGISKTDCYNIVNGAGIALPAMYRLGFDNNNCPGCVKASSKWYWDMIRTHYPEVFKRRAEQSRALGVRLVELTHHNRIFLDELPAGPFRKIKRRESLSCGPECGGGTASRALLPQ